MMDLLTIDEMREELLGWRESEDVPQSDLYIAEAYAEDQNLFSSTGGYIESEEQLSQIFDEHYAPGVIEAYGPDDRPALRTAFCDAGDMLRSEGLMHQVQYENYCYVGNLDME